MGKAGKQPAGTEPKKKDTTFVVSFFLGSVDKKDTLYIRKKLVFKLQFHKFLNFISIVFIQFFPDSNYA